MSYQVLARKYRPKSFDTLVGQEHVVRALTHALEQKRLHHAYLFTGTRGVGKTTLSRILAKALNCEGVDGTGGITAQPCGVCDACVSIDAGRFVDYIEMDAASNRGVDEMAQLLEQAVYAPSNARFKVYMIDEVHMLTNHAFNSMLKTLEEPPDHVKFILATTDPQKIPVTVLSRCLQFNLKQMPPGHIVSHLDDILGQEQIEFETPALRLLAQGAHGSMRDALSLTDQAIAYAAGKVTLDAVQGMLGALDQTYLIRVLDALASNDGAGLLAVADEMAIRSLSYSAALQDLGTLLHRVALAQSVPAALAEDLPEREDVIRLAAEFDIEEVQLFYQIVVHGRNELGLAPDEYAGFSMTLLRMLAFRPQAGGDGVLAAAPRRAVASSRPSALPPVEMKVPTPPVMQVAPAPTPASTPAPTIPAARLSSAPQAASTSAPAPRVDSNLSPRMAALAAARGGTAGKRPTAVPYAPPVAAPESAPEMVVRAQPPVSTPVVVSKPVQAQKTSSGSSAPPWEEDIPLPTDLPDNDASGSSYDAREEPPSMIRTSSRADASTEARADSRTPSRAEPTQIRSPSAPVRPLATLSMDSVSPLSVRASSSSSSSEAADPFVYQPDPSLEWDGNWPALAATLPVRGVAHQLAQQSELLRFDSSGAAIQIYLRIPLETLRMPGNVEKLTVALTDRFGRPVRVETEIGNVRYTANVKAMEEQAERQRLAEETAKNDPFIQSMIREFGAAIVPGSVKPLL
ncbi:DNA polymerase III subunit gamma/tau [Glaciimonas immobilis]|uniref:DNA polymerase III subunit gamma/tau n=1 Tax=Glaciimonas immobilis TaxID=728004 RepID=A0A840RS95_9BURK|nr:DNA polymerase III subunit gamma/tau [Glaciimonas immobilis]KAF3997977.1 DNA polymerase III subunit gamma/tau [Glaciimonas immobilis]MBB5199349.1 DNA polymerase-3 subunit gamma/tau [Glaciimonas immobilis]